MRTSLLSPDWFGLAVVVLLAAQPTEAQTQFATNKAANHAKPIPMDQLGAVAGKQYQGDGLSVTATPDGARLRCVFQKLEGQVTPQGLWLVSTVEPQTEEVWRQSQGFPLAMNIAREGRAL